MTTPNLPSRPHRRRNALSGEWVLVSPQRTQRPWQGESMTQTVRIAEPAYDPACYLCPGNARAGGKRNPEYATTYVFDNDYPALLPDELPAELRSDGDLFVAEAEPGRCRVVCFSPRHDLSLGLMATADIRAVIDTLADEYVRLAADPEIGSVIVFENHGAAMGASNPHPHAQIWATANVPNEAAKEVTELARYAAVHDGACLVCDYLAREREDGERVVFANDGAIVLVPFWAVWPFETMVVPRRHANSLDELGPAERDALAEAMAKVTRAYDRLFDVPFPYSMGFHQRPTQRDPSDVHLHAHYLPPLLRSATVRKYMVGFELLGMPQRDITPEAAAARLRELVSPS